MFLMFPHTQHSKLKPHHYNKYNKTVQCPTTKQYNVPQKKTTKNEQKHNKTKKTLNKTTTKTKKH